MGTETSVRAVLCAVAIAVVTFAPSSTVQAQDRELAEATDFRVRVQAALRLGRSGSASRGELEKGLRDAHPAVRVACAVALGNIGDPSSVQPLEGAIRSESFANVKTAMRESIDKIKGKTSAGTAGGGGGGEVSVEKAKYVVQVGNIRNNSGVRPDLDAMMRQAARTKAGSIKGAVVLDNSDPNVVKRAAEKRIPMLLVDGSLNRLTETRSNGAVIVTAQVDLSIRKIPQQTLRGTVSGNASATDDAKNAQNRGIQELQDRAVQGAVDSAMSSMGSEIAALAK